MEPRHNSATGQAEAYALERATTDLRSRLSSGTHRSASRGSALSELGHHRARLRPAPRARPPLPPGTASVALGAVRSRPVRPAAKLTRPRLLRPGRGAARWQPRLPVDRAQTAQAQLPHAARARRGGPATRMTSPVRAKPSLTQMRRGQLPPSSCRHQQVDGHHRPSGRNASPSGITPSTIMSPTRKHPGSWTEIRLGARAHHNPPRPNRAHSPPDHQAVQPSSPESHLTPSGCTDKEQRRGSGDPERCEADHAALWPPRGGPAGWLDLCSCPAISADTGTSSRRVRACGPGGGDARRSLASSKRPRLASRDRGACCAGRSGGWNVLVLGRRD